LADDICLVSDGGGKARSVLRPLHGKERIMRFLNAIKKRRITQLQNVQFQLVNGQPSVLITANNNERSLFIVEGEKSKIERILIIRNPDKLPKRNQ
jgi:hypothetical protein